MATGIQKLINIEKYKSPTGDGNSKSYSSYALISPIEKYKSPTGDGNNLRPAFVSPDVLLRNISPRQGTETNPSFNL